jgi:hypothetical protein
MYNQSNGNIGADGNGGSLNGELGDEGCRIVAKKLVLGDQDIVLDIGSGGGLTITRLSVLSDCRACIGIEVEPERYKMAETFNLFIMNKLKHLDFRVAFDNSDIRSYQNLNGVTKLFMYDAVFTISLKEEIGIIFNRSKSIKSLISTTKDLQEFGFNVELEENLGSLMAKGSQMSHTFYLYKSTTHLDIGKQDDLIVEDRLQQLINIASNRHLRLNTAETFSHAIQKSERPLRSAQVMAILGEVVSPNEKDGPAEKLFGLLISKGNSSINGKIYRGQRVSKYCSIFNPKVLKLTGKTEIDAIIHLQLRKGIIAPSYNGNGKILLGLIFNKTRSLATYLGVIYTISTKKISTAAVTLLYDEYDFKNSLPFDITDIMKVTAPG